MSQGEDLMSMIQNAHTALANPAPPPPTDAATAPLLGAPPQLPPQLPPQVPMGGLPPAPPFGGVPGAYPAFQPSQPPQPWLPQQPPQMAYPAPQQPPPPQMAYPAPQQPPPSQMAYPVAQAPQVPQATPPQMTQPQPAAAPAQYPSVTTHWPKELRDAVVGAIRAGWNDQQIVAQYGAYGPVAETLPQLRKDLVIIDEYTAKTSKPATVQPLPAAEEYGIKFAIQSGATDAQICAHYPHARPHLDRLRIEVQGPQRATGINAPESAGQPQLAAPAPAPTPAPASNGSNGEHDPSMVGDEFDKMGKDELRKLAEQNGIDVKGLREKNLRIQVRNALKNRQPGAPAPAPQNTNMQPQMLPGLFPQPVATQSINQAVQSHLAQPQPAVLTGAAADAIRQALGHLNKVGDELRKLIGAD